MTDVTLEMQISAMQSKSFKPVSGYIMNFKNLINVVDNLAKNEDTSFSNFQRTL